MAEAVTSWLEAYGYWAVLTLVLIESLGVPAPGEITLITAGAFAGSTGRLVIGYVIAAAAVGAIAGAQVAYILGSRGRTWLSSDKLERGRQLMARYGWLVIVGGRFIVVLRSLIGWVAGAGRLDRGVFFATNSAGAILWASAYGLLGWTLGSAAHRFADWAGVILGAAVLFGIGIGLLVRRRLEA